MEEELARIIYERTTKHLILLNRDNQLNVKYLRIGDKRGKGKTRGLGIFWRNILKKYPAAAASCDTPKNIFIHPYKSRRLVFSRFY